MLVTDASLRDMFVGFRASFNKGWGATEPLYPRIAIEVPSSTGEEVYPWLGQFPNLREWIGDRVIKTLVIHGFAITNRKFETTVEVPREKIEDDSVGVFSPMFQEMGANAKQHPDSLIFELLANGFTEACYDKKPFFASDHPVKNAQGRDDVASNMQAGNGPAWYLFDTSRPFKAMVWQPRTRYEFQQLTAPSDPHVVMSDNYIYGIRARGNAGFGLWQLAFGSKAPLTAENYEAARAAMMGLCGDAGRKLGIKPNVLVVPGNLEGAGRRLVNNDTRVVVVGDAPNQQHIPIANEWKGSAELVVSTYL